MTRARIRVALLPVLAASLFAVQAQVATACPGARSVPGPGGQRAAARTTLCLLNAERQRRGLRQIRLNRRLSAAARGHASDMVQRSYFSHDSLSGLTFLDRIRLTGYLATAVRWVVGENLAWGSRSRAAPAPIVHAWMRSPGHRANILRPGYRQIGLGVVAGAPARVEGPAATYVTEFGARY
jgi:uncharacterized protein YkwD